MIFVMFHGLSLQPPDPFVVSASALLESPQVETMAPEGQGRTRLIYIVDQHLAWRSATQDRAHGQMVVERAQGCFSPP